MKVKGLISVLGFQGFDLIQNRLPRIAHAKTCLWEAITGAVFSGNQTVTDSEHHGG
jgi:hypothetical protein